MPVRVGVIGVQGDVSEHLEAVRAAMRLGGFAGDAVTVRRREDLAVEGLDGPFRGVFIRAPAITRAWGRCAPLARVDGRTIVLARQGHLWGACFHPELSGDLRIHVAFLRQV